MLLLDYLLVDFNFKEGSIPRPPCSANDTAPFDNVIDMRNDVCDPLTHQLVDSSLKSLSNSAIAFILSGNIFEFQPRTPQSTFPDGYWQEPYAGTFAFRVYARNLVDIDTIWKTPSGLFKRGYFPCANAWADNLLGGSSTAPGCTNSIPEWYRPIGLP